jgi:cell division protein FtsI (penicillin-binding protein 3)
LVTAAPPQQPAQAATKTVVVNQGKVFRVPSLTGLAIRKAIEQAALAGLEVQVSGNGTVKQQAPAAGALVPAGTKIVVKCGR